MNNFRSARKATKLTLKQVAEKIGMGESTISLYESGAREPDHKTLLALSKLYGVSIDYLLGNDDQVFNFPNISQVIKRNIPFLGKIACGEPIFASEEKGVYVEALSDLHVDFCLQAQGDSMIGARIKDGDLVFIRKQEMVENGEIAAVRIGDEATLKKVYYDGESLILMPCNSAYLPKTYTCPALDEIKIEGKAVGFTHWFRR